MVLKSALFKDNARLQRCAIQDAAHVTPNQSGDHVALIQSALIRLDGATIDRDELMADRYGRSTAAAVLAYKTNRKIVNTTYQTKPDNIVGKMTIAHLDEELLADSPSPPPEKNYAKFLPPIEFGGRKALTTAIPGPHFEMMGGVGFDPFPFGKELWDKSYQMVPLGGERRISLANNGNKTLSIRLYDDQDKAVSERRLKCEPTSSSIPGMQEYKLTGKAPGRYRVQAYDDFLHKDVASLFVDVVRERAVTFGFVVVSDPKHDLSSSPFNFQAFVDGFNSIWEAQANVTGKLQGANNLLLINEIGDLPSQKTLDALEKEIKSRAGDCNRAVALIWNFDGPDVLGYTPSIPGDVVYVAIHCRPESTVLSHEFGHSIGLGHSSADGDSRNLMFETTSREMGLSRLLKMSHIRQGQMTPSLR